MTSHTHDALIAELWLLGRSYPVFYLNGYEAINEPYCFKLRIQTPHLCDSSSILGQPARLVFSCSSNESIVAGFPATREIPGIIFKHQVHAPVNEQSVWVELELRPRLSLLGQSGKARVYVNKTAREIVRMMLIRIGYGYDELAFYDSWAGKPLRYPHWVQAAGEDDLAFMHRVLSREGISYFWCKAGLGGECIWFMDDVHLHPDMPGKALYHGDDNAMPEPGLRGVYQVSTKQLMPTYSVTYRDVEPASQSRVMEVRAGKGSRPVMVWGYGAQSRAHLQRAATHHHEQLMMDEVTHKATSYNPYLRAGHHFSLEPSTWFKEKAFHFIKIEHHFESGHYYNHATFLPKDTPVRPALVKRDAGQTVHTAVIHSDDDLPYLNHAGQYTYYTHVHNNTNEPPDLQHSHRLTPFGGKATGLAMGMHFPLRRQAEVLVMYLHNDFNQPVLQNSPSNGLNHPPVTRDNSWSVLLKTAWGQYMEFCDKLGREKVTLSSANGRNHLTMQAFDQDHHVTLQCAKGCIEVEAVDDIRINCEARIKLQTDAMTHTTAQCTHLKAASMHVQAQEIQIEAENALSIDSNRHIEASANNILLHSDNELYLTATGSLMQIELEDGSIAWEADHIEISAAESVLLSTPGASIELNAAGIAMHAARITASTPALIKGVPVAVQSLPIPHLIPPKDKTIETLLPVKTFLYNAPKTLQPPQWSSAFYQVNARAHIFLEVQRFEGNEPVQLTIVRYHHASDTKPLPKNPLLSDLRDAPVVDTHEVQLGDAALYVDETHHQKTPGTALLSIPYSLDAGLFQTADEQCVHDPYYIRVRVGDVDSQVYSEPMIVLCTAQLTLKQDKAFAHNDTDAILTVTRTLPQSLRAHPQCPSIKDARYYRTPTKLDNLPAGTRNRITLKERGHVRELMHDDGKYPTPWQFISIKPQENNVQLTRLMPPIIFDLTHATFDCERVAFETEAGDARAHLTQEEVDYIQANGNNMTVFIHGYNVEYGSFNKHISELNESSEYSLPVTLPHTVLLKKDSVADATIFRDAAYLKQQHANTSPDLIDKQDFCKPEQLNGTGVHEWVINLEHQLNLAAGFDGVNYNPFTRCLFIAWPGNPKSQYDYVTAVYESVRMGKIVAQVIQNLHKQVPNLKLNIIAHSQGNGVLIHALNTLGLRGTPMVEHAFMWQAAIPNDALAPHTGKLPPKHNLWYCPNAHRAAKQFSVFFSENDNILGGLLSQQEQPEGVNIKDVWMRKPSDELRAGIFLKALGLEGLYQVAVWLDASVTELLEPGGLETVWNKWRTKHPTFRVPNQDHVYACEETLEDQCVFLKQHKLEQFIDHDFKEKMHQGIQDMHEIFKQRFHHLEKMETAGFVALNLATMPALNGFFGLMMKIVGIQTPKALASRAVVRLIANYCSNHITIIEHLLTLARMTVLCGNGAKPAMGYSGVDDKNPELKVMLDSRKIKNFRTTEWVWCHSDMKIPSKDIFENIYIDKIVRIKDNAFGLYELK